MSTIAGAVLELTGIILDGGTASQTVELSASKAMQTVAITGTGNYVKSASPTLTGTVALAAFSASGNATVGGTLGVTGATTLGNLLAVGPFTPSARTGQEAIIFRHGAVGAGSFYAQLGSATGSYNFNNAAATVSLLSISNAGVLTLSAYGSGGGDMTAGSADSGGVGYKVLRVPN